MLSLTRGRHRAYGPPAVSFSCLDTEGGKTSLKRETRPKYRESTLKRKAKDFFEIDRERRASRSSENGACGEQKSYFNNV